MCSECDWGNPEDKHRPLKRCDCGHTKWTRVIQPMAFLDVQHELLFRCAKCDHLQVAIREMVSN